MTRNTAIPCPLECVEQERLFQWAEMQKGKYPELGYMHHIANGGSRNKAEAARLKRQGVKPGVPDVFLPVAKGKYHGLYIEMKRESGGRTSKKQKEWIEGLTAQGYRAVPCHGMAEAVREIEAYMAMGSDERNESA